MWPRMSRRVPGRVDVRECRVNMRSTPASSVIEGVVTGFRGRGTGAGSRKRLIRSLLTSGPKNIHNQDDRSARSVQEQRVGYP